LTRILYFAFVATISVMGELYLGYAQDDAPVAETPPADIQPMLAPVSAPRAAPLSKSDCPETHPIKGNAGSMIYHAPGGQFYSRTDPEACFLTGADAEAAGFRASQR